MAFAACKTAKKESPYLKRPDDRIHPFHDHPQPITHFVVIISLTHKAVHLILLALKSDVLSTRLAMGVKTEEITKRLDSDGRDGDWVLLGDRLLKRDLQGFPSPATQIEEKTADIEKVPA